MLRSVCGLSSLIKSRYLRVSSVQLTLNHHRGIVLKCVIGITSGWVASTMSFSAEAATLMNNSGIQFEQDTMLESNFVESHGAYQSTFGVINLDTQEKTPLLIETRSANETDTIFRPSTKLDDRGKPQDFLGTPGVTVPKASSNFTFKANAKYAFYLESTYNGRPVGILYSNDVLNPDSSRQVQFRGSATDLCSGGMTVAWDDTGSRLVKDRPQRDADFDDFVVQLRQSACPVGGAEQPPVGSDAPPPPPVAALPATPAGGNGGSRPEFLLLPLLAFLAGGDGGNNGSSDIPPGGSSDIPPGGSIKPPGFLPPGKPQHNPPTGVPEPMTILGSGVAIGMAGLLQRRRKQTKKSDD